MPVPSKPKTKTKTPKLTLEFQERVGPYERACFCEGDLRVADVIFVGNVSMGRIVKVLRDAGVEITTDSFRPIRGN